MQVENGRVHSDVLAARRQVHDEPDIDGEQLIACVSDLVPRRVPRRVSAAIDVRHGQVPPDARFLCDERSEPAAVACGSGPGKHGHAELRGQSLRSRDGPPPVRSTRFTTAVSWAELCRTPEFEKLWG